MSIKSRLEKVYPGYELVTYSKLSNSLLSECPACGEKQMEMEHEYYPDSDSYIECKGCGTEFDFKTENTMWIKKREQSKGN